MSYTVQYIEQDLQIPTLSAVLNPGELSKYLYPVLPATWGTLHDIGVRVLQHHAGSRCTVEIALQTTSGEHELIGKAYATDRLDVCRVMEKLARDGFGPEEEFSVPQPLAYVPALHLLLQEKVHGSLAKEIFLQSNDQCRALAAQRSARWLAAFHATDLQAERIFKLSDQLPLMEQWTEEIATISGSLKDKAYQLLRGLEAVVPGLGGAEACAGHGSYSPLQIVFAKGRTVTFDWDGYCMADPNRDLARFIIALRRLALGRLRSIRALDTAAELFLRTYIAMDKSRLTAQLPAYESAICLEFAHRVLRHKHRHWQMKVEVLVGEGLRILEENG